VVMIAAAWLLPGGRPAGAGRPADRSSVGPPADRTSVSPAQDDRQGDRDLVADDRAGDLA
jgi:hypothetical protein